MNVPRFNLIERYQTVLFLSKVDLFRGTFFSTLLQFNINAEIKEDTE